MKKRHMEVIMNNPLVVANIVAAIEATKKATTKELIREDKLLRGMIEYGILRKGSKLPL